MASNRLEFTGGLVKLLALNVSFAVKLLTMFAKSPFCMLCNARMNSLFLTSPNAGSFHGKIVGTFGRKLSSLYPLMHKLPPKLLNLQTCAIWLEGSVGGSYLQERRQTPACKLPTSISHFDHLQGSGAHRSLLCDETFWSSPHPKWCSTRIQEDALKQDSTPSHCAWHR